MNIQQIFADNLKTLFILGLVIGTLFSIWYHEVTLNTLVIISLSLVISYYFGQKLKRDIFLYLKKRFSGKYTHSSLGHRLGFEEIRRDIILIETRLNSLQQAIEDLDIPDLRKSLSTIKRQLESQGYLTDQHNNYILRRAQQDHADKVIKKEETPPTPTQPTVTPSSQPTASNPKDSLSDSQHISRANSYSSGYTGVSNTFNRPGKAQVRALVPQIHVDHGGQSDNSQFSQIVAGFSDASASPAVGTVVTHPLADIDRSGSDTTEHIGKRSDRHGSLIPSARSSASGRARAEDVPIPSTPPGPRKQNKTKPRAREEIDLTTPSPRRTRSGTSYGR